MKRTLIGSTLALFALAAIVAVPLTSQAEPGHDHKHDHASDAKGEVAVGQPAPAFTLTSSEGNQHSIDDFAGKIVVLEWTNMQCPFVKKHYKNGDMQALQEKYTGDDVVWLTVASSAEGNQGHESSDQWQETCEKQGMHSTAVLIDADGKVGKAYGATNTPHMYVIDGEGVLQYMGAIDSNPSADAADVEGATNYVVQAIEALQNGTAPETASTKAYGCSVKY